eukprot:7769442-Pyramimonas_sp.AAC.1
MLDSSSSRMERCWARATRLALPEQRLAALAMMPAAVADLPVPGHASHRAAPSSRSSARPMNCIRAS